MKVLRAAITAGAVTASTMLHAQEAQQPSRNETEARSMLEKLVSFRTVAGGDELPKMADYLSSQFKAAGFSSSAIELVPVEGRLGMIVRYKGSASSTKKPVVFLAHMDVVDARREEWKSNPWTLIERGGALYGRGVVDNKIGVLTLAHAFMRLKREGFVPDRDLILAFSGDEETGMRTTRAMAERLKGAEFAINSDAGGGYRGKTGEVTYSYQAAEKTYATFEMTVRNKGGHSSRPRSDNAIYELGRVLQKISEHRFQVRWNDISIESFRALLPTLPAELKTPLARFVEAPSEATGEALLKAEPGLVGDIKTTCVPTMLRAGIVENALPTEATATINCRIFPGETVAEVQSTLGRVADEKNLEIKVVNSLGESPISSMPGEARTALDTVLAVRAPTATVSAYMEAGGTDGLQFRRAGIPTIAIGPLFSTDDSDYNFHGIDERIPMGEFREALDHYYLFMKALAGSSER